MAANDIMPYQEHSQSHRRAAFDLNSSASFEVGEPVVLNANGEIIEAADPAAAFGDVYGVAADSSLDVDGTNRAAAGNNDNMVTVWPAGQLFKTARFSTNGTSAATPTQAHIGDIGQLNFISPNWYADVSAGTTILIEQVLDVDGKPISHPDAGSAVWVVFRLIEAGSTVVS